MRRHLRWFTCEKCEGISFMDPAEAQAHEDQCDGTPPPSEPPPPNQIEELLKWDAAVKAQEAKNESH